jgi:hypothetical protein
VSDAMSRPLSPHWVMPRRPACGRMVVAQRAVYVFIADAHCGAIQGGSE